MQGTERFQKEVGKEYKRKTSKAKGRRTCYMLFRNLFRFPLLFPHGCLRVYKTVAQGRETRKGSLDVHGVYDKF
jgi:hypothetical protein